MSRWLHMLGLVAALGTATCTSDDRTSPDSLFAAAEFHLEVDYADNAQPFVEGVSGSPWQLTRENLDAVFDGTKSLELVLFGPECLADAHAALPTSP